MQKVMGRWDLSSLKYMKFVFSLSHSYPFSLTPALENLLTDRAGSVNNGLTCIFGIMENGILSIISKGESPVW